jgi:predicted ATPase/class 3 adenylate cyclase
VSHPLPAGTITFLFSDIEGSTVRWETRREAMQRALARHDCLMRGAIESHDGFVFKTVGDAFCCAFENASDAVAAAIEAQRALVSQDWGEVDGMRVRMSIHTGEAELRDGDYFGPTVNRVARLLSTAHGEQIVVSRASAAIAEARLPPQTTLRDLGTHRLKDLPAPETVYQLIAAGLRDDFPPLRSIDANPTNIPAALATFLGREEEIAAIEELLANARLVTITGSGGVGKTSTALRVAAATLGAYPDGAFLAELAPLQDPSLVSAAIATAIGFGALSRTRRLIEEIGVSLKNKKLLIVLDNCEHLIAAAAEAAEYVLQQCPLVRILATSREALDIPGEQTYRMPSLPENVAVELFAQRARSVQRSFELTEDNTPIVTDIVRRLDGIALAIELAASRVKILSVDRIDKGLDDRLKLLTGGSRTALPRQQTLRAMIGWSYDLLTAQERSFIAQLSIFRGGFTLDAAFEVCADDRFPDWDPLALVMSLAEKSLLVVDPQEHEPRYRLLESTREFALERLKESGAFAAVAARHFGYFLRASESAHARYFRTNLDRWHAQTRPDYDNFRAAIDWAFVRRNDRMRGMVLIANLAKSEMPEIGGQIVEAEQEPGAPRNVRARVALGVATHAADRKDTLRFASEAVELLQDAPGEELVDALVRLGASHWKRGHPRLAREYGERALSITRSLNLPNLTGQVLSQVALWIAADGDVELARTYSEEARAVFEALGDTTRLSIVLANLGELNFCLGDVGGAFRCVLQGLELDVDSNDQHRTIVRHLNAAAYLLALGRAGDALEHASKGFELAISWNESFLGTVAIGHLAQLTATFGNYERAGRLVGYVDAAYRAQNMVREPTERQGYEITMKRLREVLSDECLAELLAKGAALSEEEAVREARLVAHGAIMAS